LATASFDAPWIMAFPLPLRSVRSPRDVRALAAAPDSAGRPRKDRREYCAPAVRPF